MAYSIGFDIFANDRASKVFDKVGDKVENTETRTKKAGDAAGKALLGMGAAVVLFGKKSVDAYAEAEESQKSLAFAFEKFPALASTSQAELQKLNSELQKKTKYDDDNIASGQAVLAQFKVTGKQIKDTTPLLLDYASKTGKDIPAAAQDVGKALLGNAKALKNIGISYKSTGDKTKDFENITALMREKVGGFAEKEATTAAGKTAILGNQFGELQETIGQKLIPIMYGAVEVGTKMIDWVTNNTTTAKILAGAVIGVTATVWGVSMATKAWTAATTLWTGVTKTATVVQKLFNAAMKANPIGLVITAIALLAAGLIYAYKKSETFRNIVDGSFKVVKKGATDLWERGLKPALRFIMLAWVNTTDAIIQGAARAFGWVPGIGPKLKAAAKAFATFKSNVNTSLGGIKDQSVTVRATYSATAGGATITAGNFSQRHGLAKGGPIPASWGTPGKDSVPAMLMPNEYVVRADGSNLHDAIAYYGKGYAKGGVVMNTSTPTSGSIASVSGQQYNRAGTGALAGILRSLASSGAGAGSGGSGVGSGVYRWTGLILRALSMLGQSPFNLGAVLRRINLESGGNPNAINLWDSNAKAGYPSRGLMQTIPATFNAYAGPFRGLGITNPMASIYAGLNYAISRYGSIGAIDPRVRPTGYDRGGYLMPGMTTVYNGTGKPELVVPPGAGMFSGRGPAGNMRPIELRLMLGGREIQRILLEWKRQNGNMELGIA